MLESLGPGGVSNAASWFLWTKDRMKTTGMGHGNSYTTPFFLFEFKIKVKVKAKLKLGCCKLQAGKLKKKNNTKKEPEPAPEPKSEPDRGEHSQSQVPAAANRVTGDYFFFSRDSSTVAEAVKCGQPPLTGW
jgi:hypothetical protein